MFEIFMIRAEQRFQDMIEAGMTRAGAREAIDSNSGQGVNTGKSSLTPGDFEATNRSELVDASSVDVGPREFSSIKQAVPKFSGLQDKSGVE